MNGDVFGRERFAVDFDCLTASYGSSILAAHSVDTTVSNRHVLALGEMKPVSTCADINVVNEQSIATFSQNRGIATSMDVQVPDFHIFTAFQGDTRAVSAVKEPRTVDFYVL